MTRVFNDNELRIASDIARHSALSLSTVLKQLNAQYGVQQWEHIMSLSTRQRAHLRTIAKYRARAPQAIALELSAQYGARWGSKLQNIARSMA